MTIYTSRETARTYFICICANQLFEQTSMFSFQETQCERLEPIQPSSFCDRFYNSTIVTVLVLCRPPMLTRGWQRETETGKEWKTCWRKAPSSLFFLVFLGMDAIVVQDKTSGGMVVITGQDIVAGPQAERRLTKICFVFFFKIIYRNSKNLHVLVTTHGRQQAVCPLRQRELLISATSYWQGPSSCQSTLHITIHSAPVRRACSSPRTETERAALRSRCEMALTASLVLHKAPSS